MLELKEIKIKKIFVLILLVSMIMLNTISFAQDKPMISFTFDDGHISVVENVLPLFKKYNIQGTAYIITKETKEDVCYYHMNWSQINTLFKNGWEIGSHTHTHPYLTKLTNKEIIFELDKSIKHLKEHGFNPISFASPYGDFNSRVMELVEKRFQSHRMAWDVEATKNTNGFNPIKDVFYISAFEFKNTTTVDEAKKMVDLAIENKTWLVFLFHTVKKDGDIKEWDYDIKRFEKVVKYIADQGVEVLTLSNALKIK